MERLDGNAAGGILEEVFARDVTTAMETCAHCGRAAVVATAHVYMGGMGTVLRCPTCGQVLITVVHVRDDLHVDLSGMRRIELR